MMTDKEVLSLVQMTRVKTIYQAVRWVTDFATIAAKDQSSNEVKFDLDTINVLRRGLIALGMSMEDRYDEGQVDTQDRFIMGDI